MTTNNKKMIETPTNSNTLRGKPNLPLIGLLVIQIFIGYEWLLSGIAKFASGDFVSGLADELTKDAANTPAWYASFLNSFVIPNGTTFGYLIETAEVLAGIVLIIIPLLWIFALDRLPGWMKASVLYLMIAAAIGGVFMALNFHIASGANHPWVIPDSGFDEGIDVDLLLSAIQIVIVAVQIFALNAPRRESTGMIAARSQVKHPA